MPNKDSLREEQLDTLVTSLLVKFNNPSVSYVAMAVLTGTENNPNAVRPEPYKQFKKEHKILKQKLQYFLTSHIEEAAQKKQRIYLSGCCKATMTQETLMNGKPLKHPYRWYLNKKGTALKKGFSDTQFHYCDDCGQATNPQEWIEQFSPKQLKQSINKKGK